MKSSGSGLHKTHMVNCIVLNLFWSRNICMYFYEIRSLPYAYTFYFLVTVCLLLKILEKEKRFTNEYGGCCLGFV